MKPIMEHKLVCYITAVVGYLCYQHPSSVSPRTHVITKISYSYCDVTNTSVYYSSFGADNLSMGYFFILLLHELFGIQDCFTDSKRASYQQFVRWNRSQLYPSTLVQYLCYYLSLASPQTWVITMILYSYWCIAYCITITYRISEI